MPRIVLPFVVCLSLLCSGQDKLPQPPTRPERIRVGKYGFSLEAPSGWRVGIGKDGLPLFVNFPWSRMQAQARLPKAGATINVVAWERLLRRRGDETLSGWASLDAVNAAPGTVVSVPLDVPPSTDISEAFWESFDEATFGPDDQAQREVSLYWTYGREKLAAHLFYVVGDPKGGAYETALRKLVFSIRPLG